MGATPGPTRRSAVRMLIDLESLGNNQTLNTAHRGHGWAMAPGKFARNCPSPAARLKLLIRLEPFV